MKRLRTTSEVIDTLGGTSATARVLGTKPPNVSNWRAANRFPPEKFLILIALLKKRDCIAPPELWGIEDPRAVAS